MKRLNQWLATTVVAIASVIAPLTLVALVALTSSSAHAQDFPNKPLKLVVPYPPGASTDLMGRTVGAVLTQSLGQPVVVENRGGASGNIGSEYVAKSAPDGYTFMVGTDATHATNLHLAANPTFDPVKDFTALTMAAANPIVLVVNPQVPVHDVKELIAYGREHPEGLSYGSSGTGSPHHLAGVLLRQVTGVPFVHVSYRGGGPALNDVLGNQIPMIFASVVTVLPHIKSGKLRAIAVTQSTRFPGLPEVPTFGETLPGFELNSWLGFFAPARLPAALTKKLNEAIVKALRTPNVQSALDSSGLMVVANSPEEFAAQVARDTEQRGKLVKEAGITPE